MNQKILLPKKKIRAKNLNLFFKEDIHKYYLLDKRGKIKHNIPSVTQILSSVFPLPFYIKKATLERAAKLGTEVHKATEEYDLYNKSLDIPQIRGYKSWKHKYNPEILSIETSAWHSKLLFAGTIDRVVSINEERYVVDIKSGIKVDWHCLQLAAYQILLNDFTCKRAGLYLDKTGGYEFCIYDNPDDISAFLNAYSIAQWKGLWNE